jgi:hypothetical protein
MRLIKRNFETVYSKIRNEILAAIEFDEVEAATIPGEGDDIPLGFAKEIISAYDKEQENQQSELSGIADEFDENKLTFFLKTLKENYFAIIKESEFHLGEQDPICCTLDAYSPVVWSLEEVPHTKMLSFFLDPRREHKLGILPMAFFFAGMAVSGRRFEIPHYEEILVKNVEAEKWIKMESGIDRRLDAYIEMGNPECRILIERLSYRMAWEIPPRAEKAMRCPWIKNSKELRAKTWANRYRE